MTGNNHDTTPPAAVRHIVVTEASEGQRVDNFLWRELRGVPRSRLYRLLRKGEVRVNGRRVQPTYRLKLDDSVRLPPVRQAVPVNEDVAIPDSLKERLRHSILYEDSRLLVVNKPAGLAVHGGSGLRYGLIEALRAMRPDEPYLELVHRLDRETSGCLLIARKRSELRSLHHLLRSGAVRKQYLALLAGRLPRGATPVEAGLDRSAKGAGGQVQVRAEGKASRSVFRRLQRFRDPDCTLASVEIDTGRTHQIRVHAAHIGHPVIGDDSYGDRTMNRVFRKRGLRRLFLHAQTLGYDDPRTGEHRLFSADLPQDLRAVIMELEEY